MAAHRRAGERARRPKPTKLAANPRLCERVIGELTRLRSPQQIAAQLRAEFRDDRSMSVSHETIYKSLYVQAGASCAASLPRVCAPDARPASPAAGPTSGAGYRTW